MSTRHKPTRTVHSTADAALWAQHDRANTLAELLDAVRAWRLAQQDSDGGAVDFEPLDVILDAATLSSEAPLRRLTATSLPEAVAAHRAVLQARSRALESVRLVWDQIEAASIRTIDRHLPKNGGAE